MSTVQQFSNNFIEILTELFVILDYVSTHTYKFKYNFTLTFSTIKLENTAKVKLLIPQGMCKSLSHLLDKNI